MLWALFCALFEMCVCDIANKHASADESDNLQVKHIHFGLVYENNVTDIVWLHVF